jgi:hypothetical protein
MSYIQSVLASLAIAMIVSAAPLTVPLGVTGDSLTISEDGGSITIGGRTIDVGQAMSFSEVCSGGDKGIGNKGHGGRNGNGHGKGSKGAAPSINAKAIYFMTNAAKNSIVALKVGADGTLSDGSITATGGAGMNGIEKGAPAAPDALFSQGAVKVDGNVRIGVSDIMNFIKLAADHYRAWLPSILGQILSRCSTLIPQIRQISRLWVNQQIHLGNFP